MILKVGNNVIYVKKCWVTTYEETFDNSNVGILESNDDRRDPEKWTNWACIGL